MRKRIFEIVYNDNNTVGGKVYDIIIIVAVIASIIPLAFREYNPVFFFVELACVIIFAVDFLLKLICADIRYKRSIILSVLRYLISFEGIIDIISILPLFALFSSSMNWLLLAKFIRPLKLFGIFKFLRHSRSYMVISSVFRKQKKILSMTLALAVAYILFAALVIFNIEPETFTTYLDAVYWATVSLTTVGYGDLTPVTDIGKLITVISSLVGVGIIALPSGVIAAGYIEEFNSNNSNKKETDKP